MIESYQKLFEGNKSWVKQKLETDPEYFDRLSRGQAPEYLWIGCSDSRVSANEVTGTQPGEIFVHRNIANLVVHTDINMLSVLQYAVEVLKVKHVIVCGHYGCGGVQAAIGNKEFGLIDNWLRNIKDVYRFHRQELKSIEDNEQRLRRLVELNITEQVFNLGKTSIVQNAWKNEQTLHLHGFVYDIGVGLLNDLNITIKENGDIAGIYHFSE